MKPSRFFRRLARHYPELSRFADSLRDAYDRGELRDWSAADLVADPGERRRFESAARAIRQDYVEALERVVSAPQASSERRVVLAAAGIDVVLGSEGA